MFLVSRMQTDVIYTDWSKALYPVQHDFLLVKLYGFA